MRTPGRALVEAKATARFPLPTKAACRAELEIGVTASDECEGETEDITADRCEGESEAGGVETTGDTCEEESEDSTDDEGDEERGNTSGGGIGVKGASSLLNASSIGRQHCSGLPREWQEYVARRSRNQV